ncbi:MAG: hypothetical protein JXQ75_22310 [Phycisphaerae bacterium]|nr:hypothetical protein [Phycisphaerae bacterium]
MPRTRGKGSSDDNWTKKYQRAMEVIDQRGGPGKIVEEPNSDYNRNTLKILILIEAAYRDENPRGRNSREQGHDANDRFLRRVLCKVQSRIRHHTDLPRQSANDQKKTLVAIVEWEWDQVRREGPRYADLQPGHIDPANLARFEDRRAGEGPSAWTNPDGTIDLGSLGAKPLLDLFASDSKGLEAFLNSKGRLDPGKIACEMGVTRQEIRSVLGRLKRNLESLMRKDGRMILHGFKKVYHRLKELASTPFGDLPEAELRETLFDISRSLVMSFGHEVIYAKGIKGLDELELGQTIDRLLGERELRMGEPRQREIVERLARSVQLVKDALETRDIAKLFAWSSRLVLDAAGLQHHLGPSRLQLLLAYTYLLRLAGWYDAYIQANEAIAKRCDDIDSMDAAALDRRPEFESGATLRRVRTHARVNVVECLFYFKLTSAREGRFVLRDRNKNRCYERLVSLVKRLYAVLEEDPEAEVVYNSLIIVQAHIARAAYNLCRRAKGDAKDRWARERERRNRELVELIESRFLTSYVADENADELMAAVKVLGEGCARERALDVIVDVLRQDHMDVVRGIRRKREALLADALRPVAIEGKIDGPWDEPEA